MTILLKGFRKFSKKLRVSECEAYLLRCALEWYYLGLHDDFLKKATLEVLERIKRFEARYERT